MRKLLLLAFLPLSAFAQMPALDWAISFGAGYSDEVHDIQIDQNGNVYTCGYFCYAPDFDPGSGTHIMTSMGSNDGFICKSDNNGNFIWSLPIGGPSTDEASAIVLDPLGNILVVGRFSNTVDFDPGPANFTLTCSNTSEGYVAKYDVNGNFMWAFKLTGSNNGNSAVNDIATNANGDLYVCGEFSQTTDFDPSAGVHNLFGVSLQDIFVAKYSSSGALIWVNGAGSTSQDIGSSIEVDASGNCVTTGYLSGPTDMDPGPGTTMLNTSGLNLQIFLVSYASNGNLNWAFDLGDPSVGEKGVAVDIDANSNIAVTGFINAPADFDPGPGTQILTPANINQATLFLAKYNSSGQYLWAFILDSPQGTGGNAVSFDATGGLYLTGYYNGTTDFDPGPAQSTLPLCIGGPDAFLAHYSSTGAYLSAIHPDGNVSSMGYAVQAGSNSDVFWGGWFGGTKDFDPGTGTLNLVCNGKWDAFTAHFLSGVKSTVEEHEQIMVSCFPNPANDHITISVPAPCSEMQVTVTDILGNVLFCRSNPGNSVEINVANFAAGAYTVRVEFDQQFARSRMLITH